MCLVRSASPQPVQRTIGATWQLLNAAGQLLREEVMKDGTVEIDMSGCARGVYYLKIKGEDGTQVKKIVLQ